MELIAPKPVSLLAVVILFVICSCSAPNHQSAPQQNSVVAAPSPSPTPELYETVEHEFFSTLHVSDEPIALLEVKLTKPEFPTKTDLVLEIQNISGKGVRFIEYGIWPSEVCGDYMYTPLLPGPPMAYGNEKERGNEPLLNPTDKAIIKVSSNKYLQELLNPKTYESCPEGHRKPQLMIQKVDFADGVVWYPNQKLREQILK